MQTDHFEHVTKRIQRALQRRGNNVLNFDQVSQMTWGHETRKDHGVYFWDGMKRGFSRHQPHFLFQYTLAGRGEYAEADKIWGLLPGHAFIAILPSAHRYYLPASSQQWTFFWFIVRHSFVVERLAQLRKIEPAVHAWNSDSPVLERAVALFETGASGHAEVWSFEERLFHFMLEVERDCHYRRYPRNAREKLLEETRQMVLRRLEHPLSVDDLARTHRLERTTFSRHFKRTTGITPAAFMTTVRLEQALHLLRSTAKLEDIASMTGFADANHLCKVFKSKYSRSPGAYRKLLHKGPNNRSQ